MDKSSKKRIFLGLLALCVVFLGAIAIVLLFMFYNPQNAFSQRVLLSFGFLLALSIFCMGLGVLAIVISIIKNRPLGAAGRFFLRRALALYPIALALGKSFGISAQGIQGSFVEVNNQLVLSYAFSVPGQKILVLAPHCLQRSECPAKIFPDATKCNKCGKCDICDLLDLCHSLNVPLAVVTGGTLARKVIMETRPQAIVAIACERDLSSGIMDAAPLPALGVKNIRPEGPCKNTRVDVKKVEEAICFFLDRRKQKNE